MTNNERLAVALMGWSLSDNKLFYYKEGEEGIETMTGWEPDSDLNQTAVCEAKLFDKYHPAHYWNALSQVVLMEAAVTGKECAQVASAKASQRVEAMIRVLDNV